MTLSAQSPNCCLMLPPIVLLSSLLLSADCCDTEKMAAWEGVNIITFAKWKKGNIMDVLDLDQIYPNISFSRYTFSTLNAYFLLRSFSRIFTHDGSLGPAMFTEAVVAFLAPAFTS